MGHWFARWGGTLPRSAQHFLKLFLIAARSTFWSHVAHLASVQLKKKQMNSLFYEFSINSLDYKTLSVDFYHCNSIPTKSTYHQSYLRAFVVTVQRVSRVSYRQFEVYRFVTEFLVYHSGVHYRCKEEEFLVPRVSGFVYRYRGFDFDLRRCHLYVIAYFCPNSY